MNSESPEITEAWAIMAQFLNKIREQPLTPSAPIPDSTPVQIQLLCTQAYSRGKQARLHPQIEGPKISSSACENQQLVLATYFSLGMEVSPENKTQIGSQAPPEGKRPDEFYGDRSKYRTFVAQLALYYGSDPQKFSTDKSKIRFAASFLRGSAFEWLEPFIDEMAGNVSFYKYSEFLEGLMAGFVDPDQYATAEREIEVLVQRGSCSSYYSQFVALIAQLGWTEDSVKIHYFRRGLKESVKDLLVGKDCPTTITDFAALCIKLDNQLEAHRNEKKNLSQSSKQPPSVSPPQSALNFQKPTEGYVPARPQPSTSQPVNDPMELDAASRKSYRRANNLCTYCEASGHWVRDCPKLKSRDARAATAALGPDTDQNITSSVLYQSKN